jgi:hypothetical protein
MRQQLLSRDQWRERGRVVTAPNEEAKDVVCYWEGHPTFRRGAWHVFAQDQTVPVEQFQQIGEAA